MNNYLNEELKKVAEKLPFTELKNKSILITGATGLICSYIVDILMYLNLYNDANIRIIAMNRNKTMAMKRFSIYWNNSLFYYIQHDVAIPVSVEIPIDYIIHGASSASPAKYVSHPIDTMKANIEGVVNMLNLAEVSHAKLLYISSGEVYGESDGNDFIESYSGPIDPLLTRSCYPISKRAAETMCIAYQEQKNVEVVIARPCHIYGHTMMENDDRAVSQFIKNALRHEDIIMKSKGMQLRSYCYIADCATAILTILLYGKSGNAYNVANRDSVITISELANRIAKVAGQKVIIQTATDIESKGYSSVTKAVLDPSKIEQLGWKPLYSIEDGISQTIYVLSNL